MTRVTKHPGKGDWLRETGEIFTKGIQLTRDSTAWICEAPQCCLDWAHTDLQDRISGSLLLSARLTHWSALRFLPLSLYLASCSLQTFSLKINWPSHPSPNASDTGNTLIAPHLHLLPVASLTQDLRLKVQRRSRRSSSSEPGFSVLKLPAFSWTNTGLQSNRGGCPPPRHIPRRCTSGFGVLLYFHFVNDFTLVGTQHTLICLIYSFSFGHSNSIPLQLATPIAIFVSFKTVYVPLLHNNFLLPEISTWFFTYRL